MRSARYMHVYTPQKEETSPRNERKPEDYYSHLLKQAFLIPHEESFT